MLGSASGSRANYPGHPPAAPGGLVSLVPDLVLRPRKPLDSYDSGELQQPGRRDTTRFFGTGSRVPMDWAASAIKPGRQSLNRTSMDRRRGQSGYCPNRHATRPRCARPIFDQEYQDNKTSRDTTVQVVSQLPSPPPSTPGGSRASVCPLQPHPMAVGAVGPPDFAGNMGGRGALSQPN